MLDGIRFSFAIGPRSRFSATPSAARMLLAYISISTAASGGVDTWTRRLSRKRLTSQVNLRSSVCHLIGSFAIRFTFFEESVTEEWSFKPCFWTAGCCNPVKTRILMFDIWQCNIFGWHKKTEIVVAFRINYLAWRSGWLPLLRSQWAWGRL